MRFPEDVPVLADDGVPALRLRAHTADDVDAAYEMCTDPEMQRWTSVPVPYERHHAEEFLLDKIPAGWRDGGFWSWAIEYDGRFAGNVDLRGGDGNGGEIGFATAPWARGQGVMTRAVRLVLTHAFEKFGWDAVVWRALAGNWASRRVAWRTGFTGFTTVRAGAVTRGVRHDEWAASVRSGDELAPQRRWLTAPVLDGDGLRLRPMRDEDADRVVEACADERTQHWLAEMPSPYSREDALAWIATARENAAAGEGVNWAVADPDSDELLGNVGVFRLNARTGAEVGYWTHPAARGKGVMTAAVRLAVRHAFTPESEGGLGCRRLFLRAAASNTASQHVARAAGFRQVGSPRAMDVRRDGTFEDVALFDLLHTDEAVVESAG
ncbi:MAG TPA: GNAT family N-acetyltransferase [Kribbellaceae bacterium]|jgi:RimJ/RimL family protein N-acetyltransferase